MTGGGHWVAIAAAGAWQPRRVERSKTAPRLSSWRGGVPETDRRRTSCSGGAYTVRLIVLARRMSAKLARRLDPEDVVQSGLPQFLRGGLRPLRAPEKWRLVAAAGRDHCPQAATPDPAPHGPQAARSSGSGATEARAAFLTLQAGAVARDPAPRGGSGPGRRAGTPDAVAQAAGARMVEPETEGNRIEEIAAETDRSERWVRRVLDQVKVRLEKRQHEVSGA